MVSHENDRLSELWYCDLNDCDAGTLKQRRCGQTPLTQSLVKPNAGLADFGHTIDNDGYYRY